MGVEVPMMVKSKESVTIGYTRNVITVLVIGLIAGLGFPLFLYTTRIYRADLPVEEIYNYDMNEIDFKVPILVDYEVDEEYLRSSFTRRYPEIKFWSLTFPEKVKGVGTETEAEAGAETEAEAGAETEADAGTAAGAAAGAASAAAPGYTLHIHNDTSDKFTVCGKTIDIYTRSSNVDSYISEVLFDNIFKSELDTLASIYKDEPINGVAIPYSETYNLVFSLFVANGKQINWEIQKSLNEHFQPVLDILADITEFRISTQVQYYSQLSSTTLQKNKTITQDELKTFINFEDWNLVNLDIHPTINFLCYIPNEPLYIENSESNSFLISQWGGVKILNRIPMMAKSTLGEKDLFQILNIFANQLLQLIGIPHPSSSSSSSSSLEIQLDSLKRILIYKNIKSSLSNLISLVKLSNSLNDITVPKETRDQVIKALNYMNIAKLEKSVKISAMAMDNSNKAFFEKKMVQQAYFPSEHKLAVFLPLLGPIGSIVVFSLLRLVKG
ncbi:GPI17 [Candida oxycetoniae]|uniref:GPI17 n=1 Tax=Candida oxycetoniae TaxID=497107 RepID=A0AAI9SWK7_9ASCO|nr:GPI17 [Candida oxycetoniae]KAI3404117.2 GPI17 [Candida oxycetoniae]